jgi:hypothetical protein
MRLLMLCGFLLVLSSCRKDVSQLPDETENGSNTFGAKVNGVNWAPSGFGVVPTAPVLEAWFTDGGNSLVINARNFSRSPAETEFEILVRNINSTGTYPLNESTAKYPNHTSSYGYYIERRFTPREEWITNAAAGGRVIITRFDRNARVVSGTFEFNASHTNNTSAPLTVTEGRFDVVYQ